MELYALVTPKRLVRSLRATALHRRTSARHGSRPRLVSGQLGVLIATAIGLICACGSPQVSGAPPPSPVSSPSVAASSGDPALNERVTNALNDLVSGAPSAPPGAVILVDDHGARSNQARGQARLSPAEPMEPSTRFRVGSVTKTFTAVLVLQLVAEGRLHLDDTMERWLPGVLPVGRDVTLRQLLNHTSGIFNYTRDPEVRKTWGTSDVPSPKRLVEIAASHPMDFQPGTSWAYSNTNYQILGLIVERASGHPLSDELATRIARPLGLRNTSLEPGPTITGTHAEGYYLSETGDPEDVTSTVFGSWADGGIVSNAADLATFYAALLGGKLLPAEQLQAMKQTVDTNPAFTEAHASGLGLFRSTQPCGEAWSHTGGVAGFLTNVLANDDGSRVSIVLVNGLLSEGPGTAERVDAAATRAFCSESMPKPSASASATFKSLPPATPADLTGRIAFSGPGGAIWIQNADGTSRRQLTHPTNAVDYDPHWSPDGRRIVFSSSPAQEPDPPRQDDLLVIDTTRPDAVPRRLASGNHPSWSKGGDRIIFGATVGGGITGPSGLFSIPSGGGTINPLSALGEAAAAVFTPDASRLAFVQVATGGPSAIVVAAVDGAGRHTFTDLGENPAPGHWSPDGRRLVCSAGKSGARGMFVLDSTNGSVVKLTEGSGSDSPSAWLATGKIVFAHFDGEDDETPSWYVIDPESRDMWALPALDDAGDPLDWIP